MQTRFAWTRVDRIRVGLVLVRVMAFALLDIIVGTTVMATETNKSGTAALFNESTKKSGDGHKRCG